MTEGVHQPTVQEIQTEMALTRTATALDRTMLAWIRTSLSLIAFGFTLARFLHYLVAAGTLKGVESHYPRQMGILLMSLGIVGLFGGAFDHWRAIKRLKPVVKIHFWTASIMVSLVVAIIGIILLCCISATLASD